MYNLSSAASHSLKIVCSSVASWSIGCCIWNPWSFYCTRCTFLCGVSRFVLHCTILFLMFLYFSDQLVPSWAIQSSTHEFLKLCNVSQWCFILNLAPLLICFVLNMIGVWSLCLLEAFIVFCFSTFTLNNPHVL
jgi:hypothetical protein